MQLLFKLSRPIEVAARGHAFVVGFSKTLALHEVCNCGLLFSSSTNCDMCWKDYYLCEVPVYINPDYAFPFPFRIPSHFASVKYG